jgi:hypothetical protein
MKNRIKSARTAAEKSTKVEAQHPSSHSNGNTLVARSFCVSIRTYLKEITIVCLFLNFSWLAKIKMNQDQIYKNQIQLLKNHIDSLNSYNHSLTRLLNIAAKEQNQQK